MKNSKWITSSNKTESTVVTFCRCIHTDKKIEKAEISVSAMGVYALYINGARIGKGVLTPGWTSYNYRIQYQTYDITSAMTGNDRIEIGVGPGWAAGILGWGRGERYYTDTVSCIACLTLYFTDGTTERIITDTDWDIYTSHVVYAEIYHGETVDMTAPIQKIGKAVYSDIKADLIPQIGEWITEHERLAPVQVIHTPKGELVVDFGQNLAGYVEIFIKAPRGSRIIMHHAEVLDKDGNFYTENYRSARSENIFICSGENDIFKPVYTFQGFRYIRLTEFPFDDIDVNCIRAIAVHSELKRTARFVCGNEKINQLYHNILWGQKSNYLDIPTDCPQRNERLGWTGDAQVFCRTAAINYDVEKFFTKWLEDIALEQAPNGAVSGVVPNCLSQGTYISAAWGDVACVAPWQIYLAYGNKELLRKHFPMMKKWVDYVHSVGPEEFLWLGGNHQGDWLGMDGDPQTRYGGTSYDLIASAFFAYSTQLLIKAGERLGEDMKEYRTLHSNIRRRFREYFMENGIPKQKIPYVFDEKQNTHQADRLHLGLTQTSLALILHFELCEEYEKKQLASKLVELIQQNEMRITTGFVGTPYILHALSENGYTNIAYSLLLQERNPSWLFSVTHGATTMWEHWDSQREDGSFWNSIMNSFNHYAYGAVFDWIFGIACGITPIESSPGYRDVNIAPFPDKRLGFIDTSIDTRNGTVRVHWYYKDNTVYYEIQIPDGIVAHLTLPSGYCETLSQGNFCFAE